jgi:hypothetical protein
MRITLATHGGQIAAARVGRLPRALDTQALAAPQKAELSRLIAAAKSEAGNGGTGRRGGGDLMSYTINIEDDKGSVVLKQSDAAMSPAFAALLDWLQTHLPDD